MQPLFFVEARPGLGPSRSIPGSLTKRHPELMDLHDASEEMVQKAQTTNKHVSLTCASQSENC
ncbi:hypothetical protein PISMIDRAFT_681671, partial [Pisolithus microcarpus 441]